MKATLIIALLLCLIAPVGYAQNEPEDFDTFLQKFTESASFQYERIKFPLTTPILLFDENEEEREFPFTRDKWPLLGAESFKEGRAVLEDGNVYVSAFTVSESKRKEFEAGYEESELDLSVVFELINGKWYVTDCYNSWYGFDLPAEDLKQAVIQLQELNKEFKEKHP
ncbi:DUF4348 domain-containing protein [Bacteroides sp. OttesenSCG-928-E20]|nr:DUF4348 domain-containing protein [Bacteroides sp. OttesenSCG-928-N06]MDL2299496.1 DUF4348 domain-containing protein [Bacteroides sp. OttesenSCG-928-E20]MDL2304665.1 DUF4348 domain-containing protein [Bacteroides sp. OttesenSCG-928-D19]